MAAGPGSFDWGGRRRRRLLLLLVAAELLDDVLVDPRRQAQRERDARRHDEPREVDEDERIGTDGGLAFVRSDVRERSGGERHRRDRERHRADPKRAFGESIRDYSRLAAVLDSLHCWDALVLGNARVVLEAPLDEELADGPNNYFLHRHGRGLDLLHRGLELALEPM